MQRKALRSLALVSLLATLAALVFVTPQASSFPIFCDNCTGTYYTAISWGTGSDCSQAVQDLSSNLDALAMSFCQSIGQDFDCQSSLIITNACFWNGSAYQIDGRKRHGCASFC